MSTPNLEPPADEPFERYAYAVSHELKAPLRAIRAFAEFLGETARHKLDEQEVHFLDRLIGAAKRMDLQFDGLLEFSRIPRTKEFQLFDSGEAVAMTMDRLRDLVRESGARIEIPTDWPQLYGVRDQFAKAFEELISNAVHYANGTPEIHIEVKSGDLVSIRVQDNGRGMSDSDHERVFEILQHIPPGNEGGNGMGLAIARRIAHHNGGTLGIRASSDKGTCMELCWPKEAP